MDEVQSGTDHDLPADFSGYYEGIFFAAVLILFADFAERNVYDENTA